MLEALRTKLEQHKFPLSFVTLAIILGQAAMLIQHQFVTTADDTLSFINAAFYIMVSKRNIAQLTRTPGYPSFLAFVFDVSGHSNLAPWNGLQQASTLSYVVIAQMVVAVITTYEVYALAYLLTKNRLLATIGTVLVALNIYILSWERVIYSELLAYWSLVTLLLIFLIFIRYPRLVTAALFGICCFVAIMVRPEMVLLPAVLAVMIVFWGWRNSFLAVALRQVALSLVIVYGLTLGYMALNDYVNHQFELSNDSNITLFGKIEEFQMQALSVDPQFRAIQADTIQFDAAFRKRDPSDVPDPWAFMDAFSPARNAYYAANGNFTPMGKFAEDLIERHPLPFLVGSLRDVIVTWQATPILYSAFNVAPNGHVALDSTFPGYSVPGFTSVPVFDHGGASTVYEPWWVTLLLMLSTYTLEASYYLFPVLFLVAMYLMWRNRASVQNFMYAALLVCVAYFITTAAFGNYAEFYRVRFPADWAMILVAGIMLTQAIMRLHTSSYLSDSVLTPLPTILSDKQGLTTILADPSVDQSELPTLETPTLKPWEMQTLKWRAVRRTDTKP